MDGMHIRLKKRREELGLNCSQLAEEIGVHKSTIIRYENGFITKLGSDKIEKLATVLKTTPAYLMGWVGNVDETLSDPEDVIFTDGRILRYGDLSEENQKKLEEYYFLLKAKEEGRI